MNNEIPDEEMKKNIEQLKKISKELESSAILLKDTKSEEEKKLIEKHIKELKDSLKTNTKQITEFIESVNLPKPLHEKSVIPKKEETFHKKENKSLPIKPKLTGEEFLEKNLGTYGLEENTIKRLVKKEEIFSHKKIKKASKYVEMASKFFSNYSKSLLEKNKFKKLENDLIKANLHFVPSAYASIIFFTTFLSIIGAFLLFVFFLFFNFGAVMPIITKSSESIAMRFPKVIWILFFVPISTYLIMYFYPSMEKKSTEGAINQELPFATINMSAISGSMIDPTKIFNIIISTKEYPFLEKEFTKLLNEINIYGYDLVTALKSCAINTASGKLSELFNGLATTISSGGNLSEFFSKRAQTLLFEHRIESEKNTKSAETFMGLYISIVIAAPMMLMLLLMMIKMGGIGISLSTSMITLIVVLIVSLINAMFIGFLQVKQNATEK